MRRFFLSGMSHRRQRARLPALHIFVVAVFLTTTTFLHAETADWIVTAKYVVTMDLPRAASSKTERLPFAEIASPA